MNKRQSEFPSEYDWLKWNAENGVTDMQITLASEILTNKTESPLEAYKWLFIALYLGNQSANELVAFLRRTMTEEQVQIGNALVESWLESKNDELLECKNEAWSQALLDSCKSVKKHFLN